MITQRLRGICFLLLDIKLWVYHFDCNLLLDVYLVVLVISFSGGMFGISCVNWISRIIGCLSSI